MINKPLISTALAFTFGVLCVLLSALVVTGPAAAQPAQPAQPSQPSLTVNPVELTDDASVAVSVALDPAGANLGALSATLDYDEEVLHFVACAAASGVCNDVDGHIQFAGFDVNGFGPNDRFLTVEFTVISRPSSTELALAVETFADLTGIEGGDLVVTSAAVDLHAMSEVATGGLNGEVLDGSGIGVFGAQVCAISTTGDQACTATTGLGAFVLDEVTVGDHSLVVSDPSDVLPTMTQVVEVAEGQVTTGITVVLVDQSLETPVTASSDPTASDSIPSDPTRDADDVRAAAGEIVVQVTAADGDFAIFGAEVCATMPMIGTQACGFSDADGHVRLSELAVGNYELTAVDPAGRFGAATSIFVGLNPGQGIDASLALPALDLGEAPEVLAFVDPAAQEAAATDTLSVTLFGGAMALLTAAGIARRKLS